MSHFNTNSPSLECGGTYNWALLQCFSGSHRFCPFLSWPELPSSWVPCDCPRWAVDVSRGGTACSYLEVAGPHWLPLWTAPCPVLYTTKVCCLNSKKCPLSLLLFLFVFFFNYWHDFKCFPFSPFHPAPTPTPGLHPIVVCVHGQYIYILWLISSSPPTLIPQNLSVCSMNPHLWFYFVCHFVH